MHFLHDILGERENLWGRKRNIREIKYNFFANQVIVEQEHLLKKKSLKKKKKSNCRTKLILNGALPIWVLHDTH